jgi:hypothetical protein
MPKYSASLITPETCKVGLVRRAKSLGDIVSGLPLLDNKNSYSNDFF